MRKPVSAFLMMETGDGREWILNTAQLISVQKDAGGGIKLLFTHGHTVEIRKGDETLWGVLCQKLGIFDTADQA